VERLCATAVRRATAQGTAVEHFVCASDRNLGHLETQVAAHARFGGSPCAIEKEDN